MWILAALALVAFVESLAIAGIVVPGVALLLAIATVAGSTGVPLLACLGAAFVGAVAGDLLSFFIGYHFKERLRSLWPVSRYPKAVDAGIRFFEKHGGKSVVIGRFVGPIRPVLPLTAGMLEMSPSRFVLINVLSAIAWAPAYVAPGYLIGAAIQIDFPESATKIVATFIVVVAALAWLFRHFSKKLQTGENWYDALSQRGLLAPHTVSDKPYASALLLVISAVSFGLWSLMLLHTSSLNFLDQAWLELAIALNIDGFRQFLVGLTLLGDEHLLELLFSLSVVMLALRKRFGSAVLLALTGLFLSASTHGMKLYFGVARPDLVVSLPASLAYPSGHSSGAMVLYGLIATLFAEQMPPQQRWRSYLLLFIPALMIGLSRVLLGVHWFSDVVGGLLWGITVCSGARLIYWSATYRMSKRNRLDEHTHPYLSPPWAGILLLLWLISCAVYLSVNFEAAWLDYKIRPGQL